jgi:cardiolipin synthase
MKMFRNGYWQKIVLILSILLQLSVIIALLVLILTLDLDDVTYFSFLAVYFLIRLGICVFIVQTDSAVDYKVAWLVFVGALPLVGETFYLLFAHKIRTKKERQALHDYYHAIKQDPSTEETKRKLALASPDCANVASFVEHASNAGVYTNTSVEYFPLGDVAYPVMLRELKKAKHYIFIEYFIIKPGKMWDSILEILKQKVKEGLDVRVVYDDVGNLGATPVHYWRELCAMGIQARAFARLKPFIDVRYNNRDHRKIMVIDGHTCFTGGINLADEYINIDSPYGHWKDNSIMLKGKAVYSFTLLFLANWLIHFEPKRQIDYEYYRPETYIDEDGGFPASDGFIQPYGDMPFSDDCVGIGAYMSVLAKTNHYCYISTPYLILDDQFRNCLRIAAFSGNDIRLLVPGVPDKKKVFNLTRANYGPLLAAGVKIYEYTPGFVHQKMFISDDEIATDGTINLDYRSLYLHQECGAVIMKSSAVMKMKQDYLDTLNVSHRVTREEWEGWKKHKWFSWALLRLVAPLL